MIDFPASPINGQVFTSGAQSWTFDGTKWVASGVAVQPPLSTGDNRIINGDMRIDQRNNGASVSTNGYVVDRWTVSGSPVGKFNWARIPGTGLRDFPYALRSSSNSAYTPVAADLFYVYQGIEADMISDFGWGATGAQAVTLSFWAYSTLTGTFSGSVQNYAGTRSYPFSYSLPTASTWVKVVVTIPGDTAGTWVMSGNAGALTLNFDLGSGTNWRAAAGAWAAGNYLGVTGAVSVVGTNAATFYVTGVKLEVGSVATPYNRQSLAKSMADCQRYYQSFPSFMISGYNTGGQSILSQPIFPVCMRASPTAGGVGLTAPTYSNASGLTVNYVDAASVRLQMSITATGLGWGQVAPLTLSAEL